MGLIFFIRFSEWEGIFLEVFCGNENKNNRL